MQAKREAEAERDRAFHSSKPSGAKIGTGKRTVGASRLLLGDQVKRVDIDITPAIGSDGAGVHIQEHC